MTTLSDQAVTDGEAEVPKRRRSRVVLYTSVAVAVLLAVLITLLASTKPSSNSVTASPLIGKAAPAVSGTSVTGTGRYTLSGYVGKWVLLNFSASWCVPCRDETPQLLAFQKQHAAAGNATVLGVEFDPSDTANLAAFLASSHATWPAISDPSAEVAYGVTGIPESYLIDPAGTVVAKFFGGVTAAQVDNAITQASS